MIGGRSQRSDKADDGEIVGKVLPAAAATVHVCIEQTPSICWKLLADIHVEVIDDILAGE